MALFIIKRQRQQQQHRQQHPHSALRPPSRRRVLANSPTNTFPHPSRHSLPSLISTREIMQGPELEQVIRANIEGVQTLIVSDVSGGCGQVSATLRH